MNNTLTAVSSCGEGGRSVPSWMEDGECDVIASATAQVSDGVAVSCNGATGASLSIDTGDTGEGELKTASIKNRRWIMG